MDTKKDSKIPQCGILPKIDKNKVVVGAKQLRKAMEKGTVAAMRPYAKEHPAHLHIDIHPDYQRQGIGTALLDHLTAYLRDQNIGSVMLNVAADNDGAIRFYEKYGFSELGRTKHEIAMAVSTGRNEP